MAGVARALMLSRNLETKICALGAPGVEPKITDRISLSFRLARLFRAHSADNPKFNYLYTQTAANILQSNTCVPAGNDPPKCYLLPMPRRFSFPDRATNYIAY